MTTTLAAFTPDQRHVLTAFALGAVHRPRTWIYLLLAELGARTSAGSRFSSEHVRDVMRDLAAGGHLEEHPQRQGFWRPRPALDNEVLRELLDRPDREALATALRTVEKVAPELRNCVFHSPEAAVAVLRLELLSGKSAQQIAHWRHACGRLEWERVLPQAAATVATASLFARLHPELQIELLTARLINVLMDWRPDPLPLAETATALLSRAPDAGHGVRLRMVFAEYLLCAGRTDEAQSVVKPLREARAHPAEESEFRRALARAADAAADAARGRWADATAGYETALPVLKKLTGRRKHVLSELMSLPYVHSLLAQQSPSHVDRALKFCLVEAGQRAPQPDSPWGLTALAIQMRRGDAARDLAPFRLRASHEPRLDYARCLIRAWLKEDAAPQKLEPAEHKAAAGLLALLRAASLHGLAAAYEDALNVLAGVPARPTFFVPPPTESWRTALTALASIAGSAAQPAADGGSTSRLVWVVDLDDDGAIGSIVPHEQKRGARGWSKPQAVTLAKVARKAALAPHDAKVARCISNSPYAGAREMTIDTAAAIIALIGHPAVEFADRPGVPVTLSEGAPRIEVIDAGDRLRLSVFPPLRAVEAPPWSPRAGEMRAAEAHASTTVLRDGVRQAQVVRFTPAQRRAALLLSQGLAVPKSAAAELQPVIEALGGHFHVHADAMTAAREVPADARLRAELTPLADGLRLRLVAAPFGADGPRVLPGRGRPLMIATVVGDTLSAQRDLDAESRHVEQVLQALPWLGPPVDGHTEFEIPEPDDALSTVEALPQLAGVAALDWPAGRPVQVTRADLRHLRVTVRTRNDWLALAGGVRVDESLVLGLEQLLQWSGRSHGRFVPLGEGRYVALTRELRQRVADLAAVAERPAATANSARETTPDTAAPNGALDSPTAFEGPVGVRVPALAAAWLDTALDGTDWRGDEALRRRIERLAQAGAIAPEPPPGLQAELRAYQLDGFQWAMRLAAAGCGACLADDMGLGKTLQALAVLLARGAGGPALVVVPTSLIGNWLTEAHRFAPGLNIEVFGAEDDKRMAQVSGAGAHDVLVVSYAQLQLNADALAARAWHTLVFDEAQALKNPAARRTQAAQAQRGEFTLALSGTPIENRLAELWSIMRLVNPGLLGTLARFNERFVAPIERARDRETQRTLRRLIAPFVLRRTRAQVLDDLPPRTEITLTVQPEPDERAHYEALRRQAVADMERSLGAPGGQAQIHMLAQLTRLRRAACDPRLVSPQLGIAGAKVQAFGELAAELEANGHTALVFSQFVDFLALLREALDAAGIGYQYLDGATPAAERTRRVAAFQAGAGTMFLISLKAGGFGLNLTRADYVVIADPWWNPAAEDQASGRAHRIGQRRPVTVYRLVNAGTLEERIVQMHQHKRELADGVLAGTDGAAPLDVHALLALIRDEPASDPLADAPAAG
jgi:superfamily II DNA or RNA helicase